MKIWGNKDHEDGDAPLIPRWIQISLSIEKNPSWCTISLVLTDHSDRTHKVIWTISKLFGRQTLGANSDWHDEMQYEMLNDLKNECMNEEGKFEVLQLPLFNQLWTWTDESSGYQTFKVNRDWIPKEPENLHSVGEESKKRDRKSVV